MKIDSILRNRKRLVAVALTVAVSATGFWQDTYFAFAADTQSEAGGQTAEEGLNKAELKSERTENTSTYILKDGTYEKEIFASDVRFRDGDGDLEDYDPTLVKVDGDTSGQGNDISGYAYENAAGDMKNYLPEKISGNDPVLLEKGDYSIALSPAGDTDGTDSAFSGGFTKAQSVKDDVEDLYGDTSEKVTGTTYKADDSSLALEYISNAYGVKESVILNEKPASNTFVYRLSMKGLDASVNQDTGDISIYKEGTDKLVAGMEAPFMNDATGNSYCDDLSYSLEKSGDDGDYVLTVTADGSYLADAAYPVTIDPTVTWRSNPAISDAYVLNGSAYRDTNFYSSGITTMPVGDGAQGLYRTYLKFEDLASTLDNKYVVSANLTVYENNSYSGETIEAHRVTQTSSLGSLTWNNRPDYSSTVYDTFKSTGDTGTARTLDLTSWCRGLAADSFSNYGILLRASDESGSGIFTRYYGTRSSSSSYTPKMVVKYVDEPATASSVTAASGYVSNKDGDATVKVS